MASFTAPFSFEKNHPYLGFKSWFEFHPLPLPAHHKPFPCCSQIHPDPEEDSFLQTSIDELWNLKIQPMLAEDDEKYDALLNPQNMEIKAKKIQKKQLEALVGSKNYKKITVCTKRLRLIHKLLSISKKAEVSSRIYFRIWGNFSICERRFIAIQNVLSWSSSNNKSLRSLFIRRQILRLQILHVDIKNVLEYIGEDLRSCIPLPLNREKVPDENSFISEKSGHLKLKPMQKDVKAFDWSSSTKGCFNHQYNGNATIVAIGGSGEFVDLEIKEEVILTSNNDVTLKLKEEDFDKENQVPVVCSQQFPKSHLKLKPLELAPIKNTAHELSKLIEVKAEEVDSALIKTKTEDDTKVTFIIPKVVEAVEAEAIVETVTGLINSKLDCEQPQPQPEPPGPLALETFVAEVKLEIPANNAEDVKGEEVGEKLVNELNDGNNIDDLSLTTTEFKACAVVQIEEVVCHLSTQLADTILSSENSEVNSNLADEKTEILPNQIEAAESESSVVPLLPCSPSKVLTSSTNNLTDTEMEINGTVIVTNSNDSETQAQAQTTGTDSNETPNNENSNIETPQREQSKSKNLDVIDDQKPCTSSEARKAANKTKTSPEISKPSSKIEPIDNARNLKCRRGKNEEKDKQGDEPSTKDDDDEEKENELRKLKFHEMRRKNGKIKKEFKGQLRKLQCEEYLAKLKAQQEASAKLAKLTAKKDEVDEDDVACCSTTTKGKGKGRKQQQQPLKPKLLKYEKRAGGSSTVKSEPSSSSSAAAAAAVPGSKQQKKKHEKDKEEATAPVAGCSKKKSLPESRPGKELKEAKTKNLQVTISKNLEAKSKVEEKIDEISKRIDEASEILRSTEDSPLTSRSIDFAQPEENLENNKSSIESPMIQHDIVDNFPLPDEADNKFPVDAPDQNLLAIQNSCTKLMLYIDERLMPKIESIKEVLGKVDQQLTKNKSTNQNQDGHIVSVSSSSASATENTDTVASQPIQKMIADITEKTGNCEQDISKKLEQGDTVEEIRADDPTVDNNPTETERGRKKKKKKKAAKKEMGQDGSSTTQEGEPGLSEPSHKDEDDDFLGICPSNAPHSTYDIIPYKIKKKDVKAATKLHKSLKELGNIKPTYKGLLKIDTQDFMKGVPADAVLQFPSAN